MNFYSGLMELKIFKCFGERTKQIEEYHHEKYEVKQKKKNKNVIMKLW